MTGARHGEWAGNEARFSLRIWGVEKMKIARRRKLILRGGENPLDYRAFAEMNLETEKKTRLTLARLLSTKTGRRLALLFEKDQWCFGEKIVELAMLEDIEQSLDNRYLDFKSL